jgi:Recombination endonuclease VII
MSAVRVTVPAMSDAARRAYWRDAQRRSRHGGDVDLDELLARQDGRCYLCGDELPPGSRNAVNVDHDHDHCPPRKSCAVCRRGLTCNRCNSAIGLFDDDPALIRRVADNPEAAQVAARARITETPAQMPLGLTFPSGEDGRTPS